MVEVRKVWLIRKDGWIRRVKIEGPLPSIYTVKQTDPQQIEGRIKFVTVKRFRLKESPSPVPFLGRAWYEEV